MGAEDGGGPGSGHCESLCPDGCRDSPTSYVALSAHAYWKILKGEMEAAEMIGLRCATAL